MPSSPDESRSLRSEPDAFDAARLMEMVGNDRSLLLELVELFVEDLPGRRMALRNAIEREDAEALRAAAHALRGTLATFAADPAVSLALELEESAGSLDRAGSSGLAAALDREIDRFFQAVGVLVAER